MSLRSDVISSIKILSQVKVQIAYLPFPGKVLVTFGGVEVASAVHPSSNKKASLVIFNTRSGLLGTIPVVVKPKKCLDPCVDQVQFAFESLDATVPELLSAPSGMALQQTNLPTITLEKLSDVYTMLNVTMVAADDSVELACTVQSVQRLGDLAQLDVLKPADLVEGISSNPSTINSQPSISSKLSTINSQSHQKSHLSTLSHQTSNAGVFSIRIDVTDSGGLKTVSIDLFVVYNGLAPKVDIPPPSSSINPQPLLTPLHRSSIFLHPPPSILNLPPPPSINHPPSSTLLYRSSTC